MSEHITLLDDITAAAGRREELFDLFHDRYIPRAEERGLQIAEVFRWDDDGLVLEWTLADVPTFWKVRRGAMADPEVARFWTDAAPLIARRTRRYAEGTVPAPAAADDAGAPLPSVDGRHHIVLLTGTFEPDARMVGATKVAFGPHLPGSVGGPTASWELTVDGGALDVSSLDHVVDCVRLGGLIGGAVRDPGITNAIKRTLLLHVVADAPADAVPSFEHDLLGMPLHIPAIRNWRLSRVAESRLGFTHCWEQEYAELSGLRQDYMNAPYHWAHVDGWFDPEDPTCIVAPDVFHLFYEVESSVLSAPSTA